MNKTDSAASGLPYSVVFIFKANMSSLRYFLFGTNILLLNLTAIDLLLKTRSGLKLCQRRHNKAERAFL